jgi:chromosomal replication initiator protein
MRIIPTANIANAYENTKTIRNAPMPTKPRLSTPLNHDDLWQAVLAEAELEVSRPNFHTWFRKTSLVAIEDGVAHIHVPNNFAKEWLEAKYRKFILRSLRAYDTDIRDVTFIVGRPSIPTTVPVTPKPVPVAVAAAAPLPFRTPEQRESGLNPRYTFASFVVGPSNELAHAAAVAVTKQLGTAYNPLFIYGGVGLGKTHLLQAIGNYLLHESPRPLRIRYISSERFTRDLVTAIRTRTTERFKDEYRSVDLLIIDDVQFLSGKERSQEELFHAFNELSGREAQIVFSSDRPPHAIPGLADRLRSRFEGGMIADIQPPDLETRVAILHMKARERNIALSDEAAHMIAKLVERNIRELEGALNRVVSNHCLEKNGSWNITKIQEVLRASLPPSPRLTFRDIIRSIAKYYDLREEELFEKSRRQEVVRPRQVAMYLLREMLRMSYPAIGKRFHGLDHTTVIHACERIKQELQNAGPLADDLMAIQSALKGNGDKT